MDKPKIKTDWFIPWLAGAMFTLGYMGKIAEGSGTLIDPTFWEQVAIGVLTFITWPIVLGIQMAGG